MQTSENLAELEYKQSFIIVIYYFKNTLSNNLRYIKEKRVRRGKKINK